MVEVVWHGRGGQGCFTASRLLGTAVSIFEDKFAIAFPTFGPERRGAPVLGFTKISKEKIRDRSTSKQSDISIVLDDTLVNEDLFKSIKPKGLLIINSSKEYKKEGINIINFNGTKEAEDILGKPITNTAMLGVLAAISDIVSIESLILTIKQEMEGNIGEKNIKLLSSVYLKIKTRLKNE